jgi:hypothetical protein
LELLTLKDTGDGTVPVALQEYDKLLSPLSSLPSTDKVVVFPEITAGVAETGVTISGGLLGIVSSISIPSRVALSVLVVSTIDICPELFEVVVNSLIIALYRAPADE